MQHHNGFANYQLSLVKLSAKRGAQKRLRTTSPIGSRHLPVFKIS
jgi:hypothetical protein